MTTPETLALLANFSKGQKVRLERIRHADWRGNAVVVRPVKSRGVVTCELTDGPRKGQWYDARPENIDP